MPAVWTSQEFSIGNQPQCQVIFSRPSTTCFHTKRSPSVFDGIRARSLQAGRSSSTLRRLLQLPPPAALLYLLTLGSPPSSSPRRPSIFRPGVGALHRRVGVGEEKGRGTNKEPCRPSGSLHRPPLHHPPPAFRHPMALRRLHPQPRARAPPPNPCTTLAPPLLHPQIQRRRWRRRPRGERGAAPPLIFFPPR
jgi:hypothetical protein